MAKHTVVMIHGLQSNGDWYATVSRALWPFFRCQSIRYRQYHALGIVNIFFWPWAVLFAGLLGWQAVRLRPDTWSLVAVTAILLFALIEVVRSGPARMLPWLLVGAFWLGAEGQTWTAVLLLATVLVVAALGWLTTVAERRSAVHLLSALPLAFAAWGAGWLFVMSGPWWMLLICSVIGGLFLAEREWNWNRFNVGVLFPLVLGIGAPLLSLLPQIVAAELSESVVWAGLVLLMMFLELQESGEDDYWDRGWLAVVTVLAVFTFLAWGSMETRPYLGYVWAAVLMVVGWFEPVYRVRRTVGRIHRSLDKARQSHGPGRVSWIAHSLGTYLSGQVFRQPGWQVERVVFVGGAISENHDWQPHFEGPTPSIDDVRNEHGTWDIVIWALWMSGSWARRWGLGGAGWTGFRMPSVVHDLTSPRVGCAICPVNPPVRVHNLCLDEYSHSTYFLNHHHARTYWLPYLWGHAPGQVRAFHGECLRLSHQQANRHQSPLKFRDTLTSFLQRDWNWYWLGSQPFTGWVDDYVGKQLTILDSRASGVQTRPSQLVYEAAAVLVADLVFRALAERDKENPANPELLEFLNPPQGIHQAAQEAFERVARNLPAN